jgi:hypothetical protein
MVRLGLAWGEEGKIFTSPIFNSTWTLLNVDEINALYGRVKELFKDQPHGPFKALVEFVGEKRALEIARDGGQCIVQPGFAAVVSNKKRTDVIDISD